MAQGNEDEEHERLVEQWKMRKLIKNLSEAAGNGTSMISLIIPPKGQIAQTSNMLLQEQGTASQIKSRVNRLSVLSAITSCRERLKLYNKVPPNGLVVFCGEVVTDEGKTKKLAIHFEPFKPLNKKLYMCDNKFHVDDLQKLLECTSVFGFIIMDGNGCLYATLNGNHCTVKHKFSVELPKKHGRGGQSANRFARLRVEARQNYIRKCAEMATHQFISGDRPNVEGLVLAGSADFKNKLNGSDLFDSRLKPIVMKIVDTSYGGENGLNQAIAMSKDTLANVQFVREKKILMDYMQEIAQDNNKYCFGIRDTIRALEMGAIKTIIVWDQLKITRVTVVNSQTKEESHLFLTNEELDSGDFQKDKATGVTLDVTHRVDFLEWLAENYKTFGAQMEFVTNRSQEGAQFVKGFGGVGGFLRWQVNWSEMEDYLGIDDDDDEAWI